MKHNAEEAAALIRRAMALLGGDFSLSEAKRYLAAGLTSIDRVQRKREIREFNHQRNIAQDKQTRDQLAASAEWRYKQLEEMLKREQLKLQNESE